MERKSHKFDRLVIKIDRSVIIYRKLKKSRYNMFDYRWTPKYVVLTLKIEGGVQICTKIRVNYYLEDYVW